ncbi:MAG: hypothetical protein AAFU79_01975 [Myxococcota bacterium]
MVSNPPSDSQASVVDVVDSAYIGADDEARRALMMRYLAHEDVVTVTLLTGGGAAVIAGYARATGWAMKARGGPGTPFQEGNYGAYECRGVTANMFTAGLSAGLSGTVEIGEWNAGFEALEGKSHGVQAMISVVAAGWGKGAHFGRDGGASGATLINGGAAGAELSPLEYVHTWTTVADEATDCAEIDW